MQQHVRIDLLYCQHIDFLLVHATQTSEHTAPTHFHAGCAWGFSALLATALQKHNILCALSHMAAHVHGVAIYAHDLAMHSGAGLLQFWLLFVAAVWLVALQQPLHISVVKDGTGCLTAYVDALAVHGMPCCLVLCICTMQLMHDFLTMLAHTVMTAIP